MDDDLTIKTDSELATIQARHHHQEEPFILAEKEWQRRLMKEQHKLNRWTSLLSVIFSVILGMIGVISGVLLQYHLEKTQEQKNQEIFQHTYKESPKKTFPKEMDETETMKKKSSLKTP